MSSPSVSPTSPRRYGGRGVPPTPMRSQARPMRGYPQSVLGENRGRTFDDLVRSYEQDPEYLAHLRGGAKDLKGTLNADHLKRSLPRNAKFIATVSVGGFLATALSLSGLAAARFIGVNRGLSRHLALAQFKV